MTDKFIYDDNISETELLESIDHLIDEDLDEYVKRAPVRDGKKVLSERAWDALWKTLFGKYEDKDTYTVEEYDEYARVTREFGERFVCDY